MAGPTAHALLLEAARSEPRRVGDDGLAGLCGAVPTGLRRRPEPDAASRQDCGDALGRVGTNQHQQREVGIVGCHEDGLDDLEVTLAGGVADDLGAVDDDLAAHDRQLTGAGLKGGDEPRRVDMVADQVLELLR